MVTLKINVTNKELPTLSCDIIIQYLKFGQNDHSNTETLLIIFCEFDNTANVAKILSRCIIEQNPSTIYVYARGPRSHRESVAVDEDTK